VSVAVEVSDRQQRTEEMWVSGHPFGIYAPTGRIYGIECESTKGYACG